MTYDVAIIGAGISGCAIARELSKYNLSVCVIEKENDVSCGTSKANSGIIHAGYDPEPDTLMAKLNIEGAKLYPKWAEELHFDYKPIGSLVVAFGENDDKIIQTLYERGKKNGVKDLKVISRNDLEKLEPNISEEATTALYAPTAAIISPYQATWAMAENAALNGVKFFTDCEVHSISIPEDKKDPFVISTGKALIHANHVVNAAGLYADKVSSMVNVRTYTIVPRRGEYCLLDNNCHDLARHVLFQTPNELGKGVLVSPTVDENILIGPSADTCNDKTFMGTYRENQDFILEKGEKTIPNIPQRNIINSFAGARAIAYWIDENGKATENVNDFIIEEDKLVKRFIHVAGISSPGLASAPAIAEYVATILRNLGLELVQNKDFIPIFKGIANFKLASEKKKRQLIDDNKLYGRIICRCEMITEAEIVQAIHSKVGAVDLDGVKRRTRTGMGRCQGGFCSPRVTEIISRELGIPMIDVTKKGGCSFILNTKTRTAISSRGGK